MNIEPKVNIESEHSKKHIVLDWMECPYLYFYQTREMNEMGEIYSCKLKNDSCCGYSCKELTEGKIWIEPEITEEEQIIINHSD